MDSKQLKKEAKKIAEFFKTKGTDILSKALVKNPKLLGIAGAAIVASMVATGCSMPLDNMHNQDPGNKVEQEDNLHSLLFDYIVNMRDVSLSVPSNIEPGTPEFDMAVRQARFGQVLDFIGGELTQLGLTGAQVFKTVYQDTQGVVTGEKGRITRVDVNQIILDGNHPSLDIWQNHVGATMTGVLEPFRFAPESAYYSVETGGGANRASVSEDQRREQGEQGFFDASPSQKRRTRVAMTVNKLGGQEVDNFVILQEGALSGTVVRRSELPIGDPRRLNPPAPENPQINRE